MIDNRAIIAKGAKIGSGVAIGPFSIIGKNVEIGDGTWIGSHVVIEGHTKIGKNNKIFQFAAVGGVPQDKKYKDEPTKLIIGNNNMIREFCSLHTGTGHGGGVTKVGDDNLLMCYSHVAHDCMLGNENVLANYVGLSGHVTIGNFTVLSGFAKVAQFLTIGDYSFIGGNTDVAKDVLPYVIAIGSLETIKVYGLNLIGLKRRGFSEETIKNLKRAYKTIFRENLTVKEAIPKLEKMVAVCPEVQGFIDMLQKSEKGVVR